MIAGTMLQSLGAQIIFSYQLGLLLVSCDQLFRNRYNNPRLQFTILEDVLKVLIATLNYNLFVM